MHVHPMISVLCAAAALSAVAAPAIAGPKEDIEDLEARMQRVEQGVAAQGAASVRVDALERQIQELTGRIEELNHKLDQTNFRLDAISAVLAGDADGAAQLSQPLPEFGEFDAPGTGPVDLGAGDPAAAISVELPLNPAAAYDYASGFLLTGDYGRAQAAFELYLETFPNHPRTPDARFRLGEIYLAVGQNANAADAFITHIRDYPNDPRAAEAHLKLGAAFSRLERPDEACTVFKTMLNRYPNAAAAVRQRAELEMAQIDCR